MNEKWVRKKGYPFITVSKRGDQLHLRQEGFLLAGENSNDPWPIPLTVRRQSGAETLLFEEKSLNIDGAGFLKLNLDQTGFYRILYDNDTFQNILSNLKELSHLDRWGIVNDGFAFLISAKILLKDYLNRVSAFCSETNRLVVEEISNQLSRLHLLLPDHSILAQFSRNFFRAQLERLAEKKSGESENDAILRGTIARELSIVDTEFASSLSRKFPAFHDADPDMRSALALAEAVSRNDFSSLQGQLKASTSDEDRTKLISAMGWLNGDVNLAKVIDLISAGQIKKQDIPVFYTSASANPQARDFMIGQLEVAVRELQRIFVGSGTTSRTIEVMIPLLGIGRENQVLELVKGLRSPDIETGLNKGMELLRVYSKFVKTYP